jgi:hypothetical protein
MAVSGSTTYMTTYNAYDGPAFVGGYALAVDFGNVSSTAEALRYTAQSTVTRPTIGIRLAWSKGPGGEKIGDMWIHFRLYQDGVGWRSSQDFLVGGRATGLTTGVSDTFEPPASFKIMDWIITKFLSWGLQKTTFGLIRIEPYDYKNRFYLAPLSDGTKGEGFGYMSAGTWAGVPSPTDAAIMMKLDGLRIDPNARYGLIVEAAVRHRGKLFAHHQYFHFGGSKCQVPVPPILYGGIPGPGGSGGGVASSPYDR